MGDILHKYLNTFMGVQRINAVICVHSARRQAGSEKEGQKDKERDREKEKWLFWEVGPALVSWPVEILPLFQGCYLFEINSAGQGSWLPPFLNPPKTPD